MNMDHTTVTSGVTQTDKRRRRTTELMIAAAGILLSLLLIVVGRTYGDYFYVASYVVLQFVLLATAWNVLGGYSGYVNFGSAGFFAVGCYTTILLGKLFDAPLAVCVPAAGIVAGLIGLGTGYLSLRLRGVFFSIATLALAVMLQTLIVNWSYVGGARGVYVLRPDTSGPFDSYVQLLAIVMCLMATAAVIVAVVVERSWIGFGLAALRDDETAAEAAGVPSLRLKLIATTLSGFLMGVAGAPFPYYITYVDPASAFSLAIAINTIAMPLIGGTATWWGPVVGALLLGITQQVLTVTISSAANLLIVGVLLVIFVAVAPNGIVGLVRKFRESRR